MFLLPVLVDGALFFGRSSSSSSGCPFGWRWVVKREIEENALPFACFFVVVYYDFLWFMMVLSLSLSLSLSLCPRRPPSSCYQ